MPFKTYKPLVSIDWLKNHLNDENLIILDCTIPKVTASNSSTGLKEKIQIKGAVFFDIKSTFSDLKSEFPNTVLSPKKFEEKAQKLGVNNNSFIVCYDDLGIYSSPRVWWNFKLMGFNNIAVLNGGLPKWIEKELPTEKTQNKFLPKGDFIVDYQPKKIKFTNDVLEATKNKDILIADARSEGRFLAIDPEPRKGVKSGHIPNSISLPYSTILDKGLLKSEEELVSVFKQITNNKKEIIFSCGTGITASVLALAAEISDIKNYSVYDGSWTEWGLTENLPIEI